MERMMQRFVYRELRNLRMLAEAQVEQAVIDAPAVEGWHAWNDSKHADRHRQKGVEHPWLTPLLKEVCENQKSYSWKVIGPKLRANDPRMREIPYEPEIRDRLSRLKRKAGK